MSLLEAFVFGIVQGITEFLPVSSSGHLKLAQHLFGFTHLSDFLPFDLTCHLGTLLAIFLVFKKEIYQLFFEKRDFLFYLFLALLPLLAIYPLLSHIKSFMNDISFLGYFFLATALLLFLGEKKTALFPINKEWGRAIFVGIFQILALFPGVSRSGATISAGKISGWKAEEAARFSFLLAIPTILGGSFVEAIELLKSNSPSFLLSFSHYIVGFCTSFFVGLAALRLLLYFVTRQNLLPFAYYCLFLGVGCCIYTTFLLK